MPETPFRDDELDRLLRDAGTRMRAATATAQPPEVRPTGAREGPPRWIVPVAIVMATAAAVVAAIWIAGPATETVRDAPADTGLVATPDSAVDSLPVVGPIGSTAPTETAPLATTPPSAAPDPGEPTVSITTADFDGAGGACLRLVWNGNEADGCFTHRDLEDTPSWIVVLDGRAFDVTVDALDPASHAITSIDEPDIDLCGHDSSSLVPGRWTHVSCSADHFWFRAVAQLPDGAPTLFVVAPSTREPITLEPLASGLPDGLIAYRATAEIDGAPLACLVIASFPDPWREACGESNQLFRLLVPAAGTAFVVESEPGFRGVEVTDIAVLSVPIVGCNAPVTDMAAAIMNSSVTMVGLVCTGEWAMVGVPPVLLQGGDGLATGGGFLLAREPDGSWLTHGAGSTFPCEAELLPTCEAFGIGGDLLTAPLPIPPWGLIGARMHDLDPVEVTADVRSITVGARSADEIADALIAEYDDRTPGDGQEPVIAVDDGLGLVTVELTLLDDSTSRARYAVWYQTNPAGELRVERAFRIYTCSRGAAAPDLCV